MYDIVLECQNVNHWFGNQKVLYEVNLKVVRGEFVSLVGTSGCGKSTLLRAMLGTHPACSGQVLMDDAPVTGPGRDRGIVYQRYSLFPFLNAQENVAIGLMFKEASLLYRVLRPWKWHALRKQHLEEAARLLNKFKLDKAQRLYPAEMSGGMCQRVAIAQALIMKPKILLLDEPFGALDEATREEHQEMLLELYEENLEAKKKGEKPPYTLILVTHELNEAIYISDRVIALSRSWGWEKEGFAEHPGATVVYDAASPASPRDPVHRYESFIKQREEILKAAIRPPCPKHELCPHCGKSAFQCTCSRRGGFTCQCPPRGDGRYVRFWEEAAAGKGAGVMKP